MRDAVWRRALLRGNREKVQRELSTPVLLGMMMNDPCVTIGRVAEQFDVSNSAVRAAVKTGEIPSTRAGNRYQIKLSMIPPKVIVRWQRQVGARRWGHLPAGPLVYFIVGIPGFVKIGFTDRQKV